MGDYVADICRMGSLGKPSSQALALHAACLEVQNGVRALVRPGVSCGELVSTGLHLASQYEFSSYSRFVVHGIGMVPYEPPECTPESSRLLEAGMVLSIETDFLYPGVGHVKIEDAVLVTDSGN
jgi:Xaa-Pro aminopeptidase